MKSSSRLLALALLCALGSTISALHAEVYELRTYVTHEGKLPDLEARFRNHTIRIFEKHGMMSEGYWVPTDGEAAKNTLIYVLRHESREAARASWKAFGADPEWKKVAAESEKNGKILAQRPESVFMTRADYSPVWKNGSNPGADAVFEMRIYQAREGLLEKLDARFRDHTIRLFNRHGMRSVAYWHPLDEPASKDTLIYIIRHESREAAAASWKAFGADPEWKKAAAESGVGRLAQRPKVTYMRATDYSTVR